jgi:hypothetical protein
MAFAEIRNANFKFGGRKDDKGLFGMKGRLNPYIWLIPVKLMKKGFLGLLRPIFPKNGKID